MPETNGLKQVLDSLFPEVNGGEDDVSPPPVMGDDVAGRDDAGTGDVDSMVSSVVDEEQEFEEPSSVQIGEFENGKKDYSSDSDSVENSPSDERLTEDGGKEEMFVDCPDELIISDNRDAVIIEETEQNSEIDDDKKEGCLHEITNGIYNDVVLHTPKEYKDDIESLREEFSDIHHHLKALSDQQPLNNENGENIEIWKSSSIHDMANECSKLVKNSLNEKLHMEEEMKKLQSSIIVKDQEIECLQAKVSELSATQNVVFSFFGSENQNLSDLPNPSTEVQYGLQSLNDSINRLQTSLAMTVNAEGLQDGLISGKLLFLEQNVSQLIGNYQYLVSEIELLRQSLTEVSSDFNIQEDFWTTIAVARNVLLEFKRKELNFGRHVSNLEEENNKINADVEKLRVELEQEKIRYANTKEKLSMAVTKGKALVQQRDSLKQSLSEKTSLIEKYISEIEEKSRALEAADLIKDELVKTESLAASLQETISQRENILSKCEEILYQISVDHEIESADMMERIRSLVDEKNTMAGVMLEFNKLGDIISSVDFPENISSSDLGSRVNWLVESFLLTKDEVGKLKNEIAKNIEVAHDELERLMGSLLAESQEKKSIQEELEHISASYESSNFEADLFEKLRTQLYIKNQELVLCEELLEEDTQIKAKMSTLLVELETVTQELEALKVEKNALERDLERSDEKTSSLRDKLSMAVKKGKGLVQDRENLKKLMDEKTEEIETLDLALQEKESMVDDFRNQISKLSINMELIPALEADLTRVTDEKDQVEHFLVESNNMVQKVIDLIDGVVLPDDVTFEKPIDKVSWLIGYLNKCQNEKTLTEQELGNLRVDFDSLSVKLSEAYAAKGLLEEALSTAENNISQLGEENRELTEIGAIRKSLENALLEAENKILVLNNEKDDAQICNTKVEKKLEKVEEEVSTLTTRLAEAYRTINSLEDAISQLETNVSLLSKENSDAQVDKNNLGNELKKLKEEAESQSSKFLEATSTIRSLEDTLNKLVGEKKKTEEEILILKKESESRDTKLFDATSTIRSLEDSLSKLVGEKKNAEEERLIIKKEAESQDAKLFDVTSTIRTLEDSLSKLVSEKNNAEEEINSLNSKLSACMEELAGSVGSLENRSLEFSSHFNNLQLLLKDETLSSLFTQSFEVKFQALRDMEFLLKDIKSRLVEMGSDSLPSSPRVEEDSIFEGFTAGFDKAEMDKSDETSEDGDSFESYFRRTMEEIHSKNRVLVDIFQVSSASMDKFFAALLKKLQAIRDKVVHKLDQVRALEQKMIDTETSRDAQEIKIARLENDRDAQEIKIGKLENDRDAQEIQIARLENDVRVLLSACTVTAQELEIEVEKYKGELKSAPELEKWTNLLSDARENKFGKGENEICSHIKPTEDLLMAAQKICALTELLERERNVSADAIQVLENKMRESNATVESTIKERDLLRCKVFKLENDLEVLQCSHQEMSFKVEEYYAKETTVRDREDEISSLRNSLTMKEKEAKDALLVVSQVKSLCDKINDLDIPFTELNAGDTEFSDLDYLKKLFFVVDAVTLIQRQMKILTQDKENLQSTVEKQALQIGNLEEEIGVQDSEKEDLEKTRHEIIEMELGMENIIHKLGGNDLVGNHKSASVRGLLSILEKLVTEKILEYDNTKSRGQELIIKLHGSQKVIDKLSEKVKFLEASLHGTSSLSDDVEERSIFEAPPVPNRSEITELEDVGPLGKKTIGQAPFAPHARSLRKGSNDHLAINIDSESDRLIKNEESDEDKGKIFKSLNTSGLIPRQGKLFADRFDGYWVSGDRALMSRPRARLGLVAYWLLLHIWLLGTIL